MRIPSSFKRLALALAFVLFGIWEIVSPDHHRRGYDPGGRAVSAVRSRAVGGLGLGVGLFLAFQPLLDGRFFNDDDDRRQRRRFSIAISAFVIACCLPALVLPYPAEIQVSLFHKAVGTSPVLIMYGGIVWITMFAKRFLGRRH
jgi:hypothetical protein